MIRGTRGRALLRLKPLENTNMGAIVEEWTRYWTKVKDERDAEELRAGVRRATQEAQLSRELGRRDLKSLEGLSIDDSNGYFRGQVAQSFKENQPEMYRLAMQANRGDYAAGQKLAQMKSYYQELVNMDKVTEEIHEAMVKNADDLNALYDTPSFDAIQRIRSGKFIIDGTKIKIPNYDTEDDSDFITFDTPGQFATHLRSLTNFVGNPKFNERGGKFADEIKLKDENGNLRITDRIIDEGLGRARAYFRNDKVARNTWAYTSGLFTDKMARDAGFDNARHAIENNYLDTTEMSGVVERATQSFYDDMIVPALKEKDNSLSNAYTMSLLSQTRRKNYEDTITINPATTSNPNELLTRLGAQSVTGQPWDDSTSGVVFNISGKNLVAKDPGGTGAERRYKYFLYRETEENPTGEVIAFYDKEMYKTDSEGRRVGNPEIKTFWEAGDANMNVLSGKIFDPTTNKPITNYGQLTDMMRSQIGISIQGDGVVPAGETRRETSSSTTTTVRTAEDDVIADSPW